MGARASQAALRARSEQEKGLECDKEGGAGVQGVPDLASMLCTSWHRSVPLLT